MATSFAISEWSGWQATLSEDYANESHALAISETPDVASIPPHVASASQLAWTSLRKRST